MNSRINPSVSMKLLGLILFLTISGTLFGQRPGDRGRHLDRIKAERIAFITEKVSLTPDEAQELWPVLKEFNNRRKQIMEDYRSKWPRDIDVSKLTAEEAERFAEDQVLRIEQSAALARELHEQLKKILPPKKIALLYEAEEDFNRKLVRNRIQRGRD